MAYITGTATDHLDMLDIIVKSACGYGSFSAPSAKTMGGTSTYGHIDARGVLVDERVETFLNTVTETFTVTCINASSNGAEVWSVSGSSSGAQPDATTGILYSNSLVAFLISDSTTSGDIQVGNNFVFNTSQGPAKTEGVEWTLEVDEGFPDHSSIADVVKILKGKGTSGTDEIYVALRAYSSSGGDYYNILVAGMTGYMTGPRQFVNGSTYTCMPLWGSVTQPAPLKYWISVKARRVAVSVKVNLTYVNMYFGLLIPYATPSEYPYPLVIAAGTATGTQQYSDQVHHFDSFSCPKSSSSVPSATNSSMKYLTPAGDWRGVANYYASGTNEYATSASSDHITPTQSGGLAGRSNSVLFDSENGSRDLYPLVLGSSVVGVLGELEGCYWVTGAGSVSAEDYLTVGGDVYDIFQNVYRQEWYDYWCLERS